jgi:hypothetical protein
METMLEKTPKSVSEELDKFLDLSCSADSNLQHLKHLFIGYRTCILHNSGVEVDTRPYHPDGAKDISFKVGWRIAEEDYRLALNAAVIIPEYKELRLKYDLTLREVEEATGISNAYLSQVETHKIKKPSHEVVMKLNLFYKLQQQKLEK